MPMTFQWDKVKEFLALPEGQKLVAGLIFVSFVLCCVITWQATRIGNLTTAYNSCVEKCAGEKLLMQRENNDTIKVLLQRFEQEKTAIYSANIAKLERRELDLDDALFEAKRVIANQKRTKTKLQTITNKVDKIVKDE